MTEPWESLVNKGNHPQMALIQVCGLFLFAYNIYINIYRPSLYVSIPLILSEDSLERKCLEKALPLTLGIQMVRKNTWHVMVIYIYIHLLVMTGSN